ncbi:sugar phosphate nucleotidyltransferase, partial [Campylobacter sp. MOP51]|uniref:sugar phosphate nucleotidyltransferase n=1 Tax=Campylobacter canis TaxID=3378588 RepID=UPI003C43462C
VKLIMKQNPITATEDTPLEQIINLASRHNIYEIPILNKKNQVIKVESVAKIIISRTNLNEVVIMAGGLGSRLAPLTNEIPKPMLKVGTKPIL